MKIKLGSSTSAEHYTPPYLLNPTHAVTINLIGCGGNGSHMLTALARMNAALIGLGHPGIHVNAFDPDSVTEANIGRQLFSPAEDGLNKAVALITRINRFYGWDWQANPIRFHEKIAAETRETNILISCVDSVKQRKAIERAFIKRQHHQQELFTKYYWLDLGNDANSGQAVLGTFEDEVHQHNLVHAWFLPNVLQKFPAMRKMKDKDTGPSCSMADALKKQDLFINSTLAQIGCNLLWRLFREGKISNHGAFLNMKNYSMNPIPVKA